LPAALNVGLAYPSTIAIDEKAQAAFEMAKIADKQNMKLKNFFTSTAPFAN
jgi:hypothetical protein